MTTSPPEVTWSMDRPIAPEQLQALMRQTTWARDRSLSDLEALLAGPSVVLGGWRGERLVAFARVLSDGLYRALIDDVVVDEKERGQGLGDELVRRILEHQSGVDVVFLRCLEELVPFYTRHGFRRATSVTLDVRNKEG